MLSKQGNRKKYLNTYIADVILTVGRKIASAIFL